jgi:DNA-binding NarL/FixJ family response regulator
MLTEIADLRKTLEAARKALAEARWEASMDHLRGCEDWPIEIAEHAVLVQADALTRRDAATALAWLAATQDIVDSDEARFERELLTGRAYANARNFEMAAGRFERARSLVDRIENGGPRLAYQQSRLNWFLQKAEPDDADLTLAITNPDPSGRAAAYAVRAWTHGLALNFPAMIADLCSALDTAEDVDYRCDVGTLSAIVHSLAQTAFETGHPEGLAVARRACEGIRWTEDVRSDRFKTLRALGYDAFMRGDTARAQWLFRDASTAAPSPAFQTLAHLDRAYVARISRNEAWALNELDDAMRIARGVAWGQTFGEERVVLVILAVLLAPLDPAEAQKYAAMYSMLGVESVGPQFLLTKARNFVAGERYANARIAQTLGDRETAQSNYILAYDVFAEMGYHYQAMLVASAMAELTGESIWSERTREHLAHYPGCPFSSQTPEVGLSNDPILESLTPLQRQLARAHWSGMDMDQLSQRFSRSLYTIERHIADIYAAFGVTNSGGLRDQALSRGLA